MNGHQRIQAVLEGRVPDRVPVMVHNFMMAAREAGYSMAQYRGSGRAIADSFIQAVENYGYDGILIDVDTAVLAGALGAVVDFPDNEPARCVRGCLENLADVERLKPVDLGRDARIQTWLEGVSRLKEHFGDEVYIRGNCDQCAFTLAGLLRTSAEWLVDLTDVENIPAAQRLLETCAAAHIQFLDLMAQTGAHMLSGGDSLASPDMVSPHMYRQYAMPWEKKITEASHALGLPYVMHICGNTTRILPDLAMCGAEGIELDYKTDLNAARAAFGSRTTLLGNIDPVGVLALGTPYLVAEKTRELLETFRGARLVVNAGCAIPPETPPENLRAMISTAHAN